MMASLSGGALSGGAAAASANPHWSQNLASGRTSCLQFGHCLARDVPHASQNLASGRLVWLHCGHSIVIPPLVFQRYHGANSLCRQILAHAWHDLSLEALD